LVCVGLWLMMLCWSAALQAQWPQWRGPERNGSVPAAGTPKWPAAWKRAWRVDVGEGYSSPVVAGGRAFVHSRRDPDEIVTAIDLSTGKVAWQQKYTTPFNKNQYATSMSKGPHATPLVTGDKVFTFGGMGILTAWDDRGTGRRPGGDPFDAGARIDFHDRRRARARQAVPCEIRRGTTLHRG
jgi:outer membrane protein assembly factor BamB